MRGRRGVDGTLDFVRNARRRRDSRREGVADENAEPGKRVRVCASTERDDGVDTHVERLSYLSYACPITGHPLREKGAEEGAEEGADEVRLDNVDAYLRDVARYCLADGVAAQTEGFRDGVSEVFPVGALAAFDAGGDCGDGTCGRDAVEWTAEELRRCVVPGFQYAADSAPYRWLLETLEELPDAHRRAFLEFVAVCPRLPPRGTRGAAARTHSRQSNGSSGETAGGEDVLAGTQAAGVRVQGGTARQTGDGAAVEKLLRVAVSGVRGIGRGAREERASRRRRGKEHGAKRHPIALEER